MLMVAGALGALIIVATVFAVSSLTGGDRVPASATVSPTITTTFVLTVPSADTFAATVCRLVGDLTAAQNDDIVPMIGLISAWTAGPSIPVGPEPRAKAAAYAASVVQVLRRNEAAVSTLRSTERAQLVADLATAYGNYASGLAALAPAFQNSNTFDSLGPIESGLRQIANGRAALEDANAQLGLMIAAGSASCP